MRIFCRVICVVFSLVFLFYLALPKPDFPQPPNDALQSDEPADTETPLRRAYFTNLTREEVMLYYKEQLNKSVFADIPLPTYRLNYPPEESQTIIRDQTRSTFLEEIVHPFRESVYVNGFEPKDPKDAIFIGGKSWRQKIIIKYIPSNVLFRLGLAVACLGAIWLLIKEWFCTIKEFKAKK